MSEPQQSGRTVKAAETTFSVLETIYEHEGGGIRLSELAIELDMAKSTIHRYLQTLLKCEYLIKEGDKYFVSLRFLDIGEVARNRKKGYRMAMQKVDELAGETDERAQFLVEEHGRAIYVHRKAGSHAVHTDPGIGKREHLHATSAGKALIAAWDDDRFDAWYGERDLPAFTDNTITTKAELMDEVERIRKRGYSTNEQEIIEGLRAIGVPIRETSGEVLGALSVSGPSNRMQGKRFEEELPELMMGFANEVELNLQYS